MKLPVVQVKTFDEVSAAALDAAVLAFVRSLSGEQEFISLIPFQTATGIGAQLLYTD